MDKKLEDIADFSKDKLIREIHRRLEKHPGDAPWSCVECYHNKPCLDADILRLAMIALKDNF
jgi:hypothetical protein